MRVVQSSTRSATTIAMAMAISIIIIFFFFAIILLLNNAAIIICLSSWFSPSLSSCRSRPRSRHHSRQTGRQPLSPHLRLHRHPRHCIIRTSILRSLHTLDSLPTSSSSCATSSRPLHPHSLKESRVFFDGAGCLFLFQWQMGRMTSESSKPCVDKILHPTCCSWQHNCSCVVHSEQDKGAAMMRSACRSDGLRGGSQARAQKGLLPTPRPKAKALPKPLNPKL